MNKYIGTKEVMAEECALGAFIAETGRDPYKGAGVEHKNEEPGYKVQYKDGYVAWSPKDVFEEAYDIAETPQDRMRIERRQLVERHVKLNDFVYTDRFRGLDNLSRAMLHVQNSIMYAYGNILKLRIYKMEDLNVGLNKLSFSEAVILLRSGMPVRREGWTGKFVVRQNPCTLPETIIPNLQNLPQSAKEIITARKGGITYANQLLIVRHDGIANSWAPSAEDVLATDWELYTKEIDEGVCSGIGGICECTPGRPE